MPEQPPTMASGNHATTEKHNEGPGCSVIFAALLLLAGYGLVNLDKLLLGVSSLGIGGLGKPATKKIDFSQTSLETYWSNGKLHYRAKATGVSTRKFEQRLPTQPGGGLAFSLRNRFGEEICRLEIPVEQFQRDGSNPDTVTACGSLPLGEADYIEIHSSQKSTAMNHLSN
jgi:hypothetical protein